MPVRGSSSYVWFTEQELGNGVNGRTYFGRNKSNGNPCVVKIPTESISQNFIDKLKKLDEQSIAKFLSTEESKNKETIYVFEFCNEYSLDRFLEKPENAYGLNDDCVLGIHEGICKGLEVIRDIGLHKSYYLKPSNVLCVYQSDGSFTFKISDYYYNSYDTKEQHTYLISVLSETKKFVNVLVWSLGAILCHSILGTSPFPVYKKSEGVNLMSKKQAEHIFISLSKPDNPEWQTVFPETVQLTFTLRQVYTQIIKECVNISNQMELNKFIHSQLRPTKSDFLIYALDMFNLTPVTLVCKENKVSFLGNESTYNSIIFNHRIMDEIGEMQFYKDRMTKEDPAILLKDFQFKLPNYVDILVDAFNKLGDVSMAGDYLDLQYDALLARNYCGFVIFCLRIFENLQHFLKAVKQVLGTLAEQMSTKLSQMKLKFDLTTVNKRNIDPHFVADHLPEAKVLKDLQEEVASLQHLSSNDGNDIGKNSDSSDAIPCDTSSRSCSQRHCCGHLKELVDQMKSTHAMFVEDNKKQLTHNDKQVHKYEKVKLKENAKKAHQLITNHCIPEVSQIISTLYDRVRKSIEYFDTPPHDPVPLGPRIKSDLKVPHSNDSGISSGYSSSCKSSNISLSLRERLRMIDDDIDLINILVDEFDAVLQKNL